MAADPTAAQAQADPLVQAYATSWQRIVDLQQALADDPALARQKARLDRLRRGIERDLRGLDDRVDEWTRARLPGVYQAGADQAAQDLDGDFSWSQSDVNAAERLSAGLRRDLLAANTRTAATTRALLRRVARDRGLAATIEGQTAKQAGREMARIIEAHGIHAVTYQNGAKVGLGPYSEMAIRTTTATAYNEGTLNAAEAQGVVWFECFDGPNCGWSTHQDADRANGKIVKRDDALEHPISHPNCRRAFNARPDLGQVKASKPAPLTQAEAAGQLKQVDNRVVKTPAGFVQLRQLSRTRRWDLYTEQERALAYQAGQTPPRGWKGTPAPAKTDGPPPQPKPPTSPPAGWRNTNVKLSPEDVDAVYEYSQPLGFYGMANEQLRGNGSLADLPNAMQDVGRRIDRVTTEGRLSGGTAYRVIADVPQVVSQLRPGAVITDPGYMSIARDIDKAEDFLVGMGPAEESAMFRIKVKRGDRGFVVGDAIADRAGYYEQSEIILPRGTRFKVNKVTRRRGQPVVAEVEIV